VATWLALVGFSFISAVTPGPNNVLLWASGAAFGFRRTLPHVLGTAVGIGVMALAAAAGLASLIAAAPVLGVAMRIAGSGYLLYLAAQIARARSMEAVGIGRPLGFVAAATFQWLNPKAWIFALGAVTTFLPPGLASPLASIVVAITMVTVIIPSAALWSVAGGSMNGLLANPRTGRLVSGVLAIVVVLTVLLVWL
jgi:threonine/homoserine/homoserine lactone efflux protein